MTVKRVDAVVDGHLIKVVPAADYDEAIALDEWIPVTRQMPPLDVPVVMVRRGSEQIPMWHWRPWLPMRDLMPQKGVDHE